MIRDLWKQSSRSLGTRPILVLSYKNHAIDEFLVDLVQAERAHLSRDKLIRIGGQCKDQRLAQFSERAAYQSDLEVKTKKDNLEKLTFLRDSINATIRGEVSTFLSHRQQYISQGDPKSRYKIAVCATEKLMVCI